MSNLVRTEAVGDLSVFGQDPIGIVILKAVFIFVILVLITLLAIWGERRDYTWYMRDSLFVRSPLRVNGASVGEEDRRRAEQQFIRRELERERRRRARQADPAATPAANPASAAANDSVKDATADLARPLRTRVEIGPEFCQLSGEDATVTAFLAQGGVGCISVTANVAPAQCAALHDAWKAQDLETVWRLRDRLMPLHDALFVETSPGPVKYAASLLGLCSAETRLPLAPVTDHTRSTVREALIKAGVLV